MAKVRVMIVEDSRVVREFLTYLIGRDPRLEVAAAVDSGEEALRILDRVSPDVISMDIRLPGMNGFEATQQIMARKPTPIVVVSASVEAEDLKISMNALRAGALAVVEKPAGTSHPEYEALATRLCTQLFIMSQVKVIRHRIDRGLTFTKEEGKRMEESAKICSSHSPFRQSPSSFRMLGLVASTGGPSALTKLLAGLPQKFPVPILLVQHITASFLDGFVSWLGTVIPFSVRLAREGEVPAAGIVYLPPVDRHLEVEGGCLRLTQRDPVCLQRPSGSVLFQSMARDLGSSALGVLLTGMGEDGAEGLNEIRERGGYTIAEDESTAIVYGMPAAAVRLGGVCELLPLHEIAPRIVEMVAMKGVA